MQFCEVLTGYHFEQHKKVEVQTCAYCACAVHMQTHFTTLCLWWLHSNCLLIPCQSDIWWLMTARRNSYQHILSVSTIAVPSWRHGFLSWRVKICILRTLLVPVHCIYKLRSHCSHCKHDLHDYRGALWWISRPLLLWDDNDCHWSQHQHIYWMT